MRLINHGLSLFILTAAVHPALAADWRQFRGPGGLGVSEEKGLPVEWSAEKNIKWRIKLPGGGASCPVTAGDRVFVTCYSGYGVDTKEPGKMDELRRHLVCVNRSTGDIRWSKDFEPLLPEHKYTGKARITATRPALPSLTASASTSSSASRASIASTSTATRSGTFSSARTSTAGAPAPRRSFTRTRLLSTPAWRAERWSHWTNQPARKNGARRASTRPGIRRRWSRRRTKRRSWS